MVINTHMYRLFGISCMLAVLSGCGGGYENLKIFPRLDSRLTAKETVEQVEIEAKALTHQETVDHFGVDLIDQGYRPLVLKISNKSSSTYVLRPSYVGLPLVSGKHVGKLLHYDTAQWVAWTALPAFLFAWPLIPCAVLPMGIAMADHNRRASKTLKKRTFGPHDTLIILPREAVTRFLFIPEIQFSSTFELSLFNEKTENVIKFVVRSRQ